MQEAQGWNKAHETLQCMSASTQHLLHLHHPDMRFMESFLRIRCCRFHIIYSQPIPHFTVIMVQRFFSMYLKKPPNIPYGDSRTLLRALSNMEHTEQIIAFLFVHTRKLTLCHLLTTSFSLRGTAFIPISILLSILGTDDLYL